MAEEQPLLGPDADCQDDLETTFPLPASLKKPRRAPAIGALDVFIAAFLPWLIFTVIEILFIYVYYQQPWRVWALVGGFVLCSLVLVGMGVGGTRSVHLAIGLLCLAATCVGTMVGVYVYGAYASSYWRLNDGVQYKSVSPLALASEHSDATILGFAPESFVDAERTLGYMEAGTVYCVAPVAAQKFSDAPQYWAAGKDCCDQRGNFRCGAVLDPKAKTGLRVLDESERWKYNTAIRMAESVYNLSPTNTGHFSVFWTSDNLKDEIWSECLSLLLLSSSMYFVCSVAAALILRKSLLFAL